MSSRSSASACTSRSACRPSGLPSARNFSRRDAVIPGTGEVTPPGAFATLHIDDIHTNPDIYTEPYKFDPDRFHPDRAEDKKEPLAYVGWGLGRHPCCEFSALVVTPGTQVFG